jgi:NAD(P)-dependent dehydrogenase (short-subunit alcohol dehydrogenase family)
MSFNKHSTAEMVAEHFSDRAKNRYMIVTGANIGLGLESVRVLAAQGAHVVLCSRNEQKGREAMKAIIDQHPDTVNRITIMQLDLGDLDSVRSFAEKYKASGKPLHVLINNAGIMALPKREFTKQGIEAQFGVNHIGHFYLTMLLLPVLRASSSPSEPARVVSLSSIGHYLFSPADGIFFDDINGDKRYHQWERYGQSKFANVSFAYELNKREKGKVIAVSLHPGAILSTNLGQHSMNFSGILSLICQSRSWWHLVSNQNKTIPQGSATTVLCALDPNIKPGGFYADCAFEGSVKHPKIYNDEVAIKLWDVSERLIEEKGFKMDS